MSVSWNAALSTHGSASESGFVEVCCISLNKCLSLYLRVSSLSLSLCVCVRGCVGLGFTDVCCSVDLRSVFVHHSALSKYKYTL